MSWWDEADGSGFSRIWRGRDGAIRLDVSAEERVAQLALADGEITPWLATGSE